MPALRSFPVQAFLWDAFQTVVGGNEAKRGALRRIELSGGRVLEVGCATGNVADVFDGCDYLGVDLAEDRVRWATRKFRGRQGFAFRCVDVRAGELPPASFDHVVIAHAAHHMPIDDLTGLIRRSVELLRSGGELALLDLAKPAPSAPLRKHLYLRLDRGEFFRTPEELAAIFAADPRLARPRTDLIPTHKFGIEVTDQVLVRSRLA